ncbi:fused isobutyryl-CoA mutase/GTPase IcmF [Sedimenticola selenatireducens]|uniref:Fused isobutyryl-CoA mutase n=1 Tax=Sedimenticola selenatireducens TaxID=191960 RepID=A0A557SMS5_9GAMM|nr:fused isobutyryl-CoA mutase/GTPase IcmF [Sedimenticola selenatireducens]TVO78723.1 methylmalonyl-CoA mutase family protein [Sedimenticola selenatireducens]TVT62085.1 MAG: methylmalonyl-CoA mutase family protein [Sedimenticola selenatireducens]
MSNAPQASNVVGIAQQKHKIRFVTAASLFDGHDASINIMRRILQSQGAEVIHLGHNRSVAEIVNAALQEDAQGIAISSYQGGHVEYLKYMVDMLKERGGSAIRIFAGGGGVIVPEEIKALHEYGVTRIFSPEDGQKLGLQGMIQMAMEQSDFDPGQYAPDSIDPLTDGDWRALSQIITQLENSPPNNALADKITKAVDTLDRKIPVLGITGTGGSGKSSLTDELIRRFRLGQQDQLKIAIVAVDPTRRKTGGALLGDRIRMNAIEHPNIYFRSVATRDASGEVPEYVADIVKACKLSGFDFIIVETPGIGQGDAGIVPLADASLYVMTPEFGAQSQLEKIDMLDFADFIAINKFDRKGADDAFRDVRKQVQRNQEAFTTPVEEMPVYGTIAARFNDEGVTALYHGLLDKLATLGLKASEDALPRSSERRSTGKQVIVPPQRARYLAEISETVRDYKKTVEIQARIARERQQLTESKRMLSEAGTEVDTLDSLITERDNALDQRAKKLLEIWPQVKESYAGDEYVVKIRDKEIRTQITRTTLSGTKIRKVVLPKYEDHGELLKWLLLENVPGTFPYTAGVFAFKREGEDPTRMFAGEGDAFRTNRRFKRLSEHADAKRLSTAFDSVTLYGCDPDERPDIYGKIGNSGVSIATLDDMKVLYDGFDLCNPSTSVSMTVNGPAPMILAMFLNTAIEQQISKFEADNGRQPTDEEIQKIRAWALSNVRGTVQADILKEDQGQNTCIFSTEFALKLMGDIQEYFVHNQVRNFYSVSISGYHIAEAGANPISQLAFTLSNGFTYVETYLARGMDIDEFAPNLSFFFSNGMDPEYTVMGRVARRIWATAMRFKYGANERSQKLKYHIQTSGRSLHAQEMDFNDIRTTLQALIAIYDNCNSLHTNAYDEAITTPTEESVRRALAIQLIINNEWGLTKNENPNQGAFIIDELTDLVEEAVLSEFERISERGGVLGAMETGYQRGKIQDESMHYEHMKHDGSLPIIGVNTFLNPKGNQEVTIELARSTEDEKLSQIKRLREFNQRNRTQAGAALERIRSAAINNQNIFVELVDAVKYCSLGEISNALYEVGGQYRRNM